MFCDQCGFKNTDDDVFCQQCGNKLIHDQQTESLAAQQQVPATQPAPQQPTSQPVPTTQPIPSTQSNTTPSDAQHPNGDTTNSPVTSPSSVPPTALPPETPASAQQTYNTTPRKKHTFTIVLSIIAALIVIALVATFVTWKMELWGGKTLPSQQALAQELQVKDAKQLKAKDVAKHLKTKGFTVKIERVFSGNTPGTFVGYQGADADSRQSLSQHITVQESAGPGVPQGTVGKTADQIVTTLQNMGVPVHYKQVAVHDKKQHPVGSVVLTSPADGMPLAEADTERGIMVGVASDQDGIPVDIQGMNPDDAQTMLEDMGYTVKTEYKFSSKQYVDKVAATNPAPGSPLDEGDSITLYIGADANKTMDLLTEHVGSNSNEDYLKPTLSEVSGTYCKSNVKNPDEDCITLQYIKDSNYFEKLYLQGSENKLMVTPYTQNILRISKIEEYNNLLLKQQKGMFELFAGGGIPQCNGKPFMPSAPAYCINDKPYAGSDISDANPDPATLTDKYVMDDFLVYVPVGSDIKAWQKSDYFDKEALNAVANDKAVDTSRPFIVLRDISQYEETEFSPRDLDSHDLFAPSIIYSDKKLVPMKPAISDKTVYYLVEQNDPDWDMLQDAKVNGAKQIDPLQHADKLTRDTLKEIAGEYMLSSGAGAWADVLTINQDGSYEGDYHDSNMGGASDPDKYPNGQQYVAKYSGRLSKAKKNDDGTITMSITYKLHGTAGEVQDIDGVETETTDSQIKDYSEVTIYPAGYNIADFSDDIQSWAPWNGDDSYLSKQTQYPVIVASNENGDLAYFNVDEPWK